MPLEIDARLTAKDALDAVIVRGVPRDARLSAGTYDPTIDGWALLPAQLPGLTMTLLDDQTSDIELTIVGINLASATPSQSQLLAVLPIEMA